MKENITLPECPVAEVPPRVEYALSDIGYSMRPVLEEMRKWGEAYRSRTGERSCAER